MRVRGLIALLVLAGCNGDTSVTKRNNEPVAAITYPENGDEVQEGFVVTFRGTVSDTNNSANELVATWFSGSNELCPEAPLASSGETVCEAVLGVDDTDILLEGRDPDNATGTATLDLVVLATDAPTATITTPDGLGTYYADQEITFEAIVEDTEDDPADLTVVWTDQTGSILDVDNVIDTDGSLAGSLLLAEGDHEITLTVTDTTGKTGEASVVLDVGGPNNAPTCSITSPSDGAGSGEGLAVRFEGSVTDPDVDEDVLTGSWSSSIDGVLGSEYADVEGAVSVDVADLSYGTHTITLEGTDDVGATCTDTILFSIGSPPTLDIDLPVDGDLYNEGDLISFTATVADDSTAATALGISWESDIDGVLSTAAADSTGAVDFSAAWLSVGTHTVSLTVTDGDGLYAQGSAFFIVNGLPTEPTIVIEPTVPSGLDDLVATVTVDASDAELDPIAYSYAWYVDGVLSSYTSDTVPDSATTRGEEWQVYVTPSDGYGDGPSGTDSVTIENTAPTLTSVALTPSPAYEDDTLTCTPGASSDADGDSVSYIYAWTVDGLAISPTASTINDTWWVRGNVVMCTVTPTDGTTAGAAVASSALTISNTIPTISAVAITPAAPEATDVLTCTATGFTDADADSDQSTYSWTVEGVYAGSGTTLSTTFDGGDDVVCTVTPYDGVDYGTALSDTVTIDNTPPELASVTLSPTSPTEADILVCTPGATTDVDGTTSFSYIYSWTVNSAVISQTSSSLDGSEFRKSDVIRCRVIPNDGTDDGAMVSSNAVTAINTAPEVTAATLSPTSPDTDDTITATVSTYDIDGDTVSLTYAWYVNGANVGGSTATLAGTYFVHTDNVYVDVTPDDGSDTGTTYTSSDVTVANTLPVISSVSLTPTSAYEASTMTCTPTASDLDSDSITYTYAWTVNGAAIAPTSATLTGTYFSKASTVSCTATPNDGTASGTAVTSNVVTIQNTAPVLASAALTPTTAYESSTMTCTPATATDADGDSVTYTYAWYVNSAVVSAATSTTLTGTYFAKGNTVYCRVTPSDGSDAGSAVNSNTVTILNTAPTISAVSLTPTTAYEASTLTCAPTSSDVDGDTVTYTYAWYVNSSVISQTSSTLTGTYFSSGNTVYCRATPSDGSASGTAVSSNTVTISNTTPVATATLTPTTAYEADTLTCTAAATDGDGTTSFTYTYAWYVNGSVISPTSSTLTGTYFSSGSTVYCTVIASDGTISSSAASSSTVTISNTAPVATAVLTPTAAYEASTFTCTAAATDADGTTSFTYTYAWYVNGSAISQTSSTLTGTYFSSGNTVYCTVIASDGTSSSSAASSSTVTVLNTAPVATATLTPTAAYESSTLTCTAAATDADGTTSFTYTYAWYVNSSAISQTSSTLTGTYFSSGNTVYCTVIASDGSASSSAASSSTVTIANTAPVATATLTPTTAYESSTLTCTAAATDGDGTTSFTYTYAWYVNGSVIAPTSTTLTGTYFSSGNTVYCTVIASDGSTSSSAASSSTVTISNTAPVATATLTPTTAYEASTFTCTAAATDGDGTTSFTYTYAWYVNSTVISQTSSTLTGTYFSRGNTVYCTVAASDGTTSSAIASSSTVTISNTAPVTSAVSIGTSAVYEASTLTCTPTSTDADGDSISYTYAWYVNSAAVAATSSTLTGTYFSRGNTVYCRATPTDGTTAGTAVSSNTLTISNSTPTAPVVAIAPDEPEAGGDDLVCAITTSSTDADPADSVTYTFTWTVDGVAYTGATNTATTSTVDASVTAEDDVWICSGTASDGTATSSAGTDTIDVLGAAYTIGYATTFATPGTGSAAGSDSLGQQITVTTACELYQLGTLLRLADTDSIRLALYTNSASSPGTLVAYTALTSMSSYSAGDAIELDVVGGPIAVTAGTYWIVHNLSGTAYMGYTTVGASSNTVKYAALSSSSAFPSSFGTASSYTGQFLNLYMVVR